MYRIFETLKPQDRKLREKNQYMINLCNQRINDHKENMKTTEGFVQHYIEKLRGKTEELLDETVTADSMSGQSIEWVLNHSCNVIDVFYSHLEQIHSALATARYSYWQARTKYLDSLNLDFIEEIKLIAARFPIIRNHEGQFCFELPVYELMDEDDNLHKFPNLGLQFNPHVNNFRAVFNITYKDFNGVNWSGIPGYPTGDDFPHPHVNEGGNICYGAEPEESIRLFWENGNFYGMAAVIDNLLSMYNPHSPHLELEEWNNVPTCDECGYRAEDSNDLNYSELDDNHYCDDCSVWSDHEGTVILKDESLWSDDFLDYLHGSKAFECELCNDGALYGDKITASDRGLPVDICPSCYDTQTFECELCNEITLKSGREQVWRFTESGKQEIDICETCSEDETFECEECESIVVKENGWLIESDLDEMCKDCRKNKQGEMENAA